MMPCPISSMSTLSLSALCLNDERVLSGSLRRTHAVCDATRFADEIVQVGRRLARPHAAAAALPAREVRRDPKGQLWFELTRLTP
jgi:hypothetical protein